MKELIEIRINEEGENCVSARELHEKLEIKTKFTDWIKRILEYGFEENIDFITFWSEPKNGNAVKYLGSPQKMSAKGYEINYLISIDMGKEICMIQRTELGRQFRKYFIEAEKKLIQITKEVKHYEKKIFDYSQSPLFMERKNSDSQSLNFLNNAVRKEVEAIIDITGIKATFFAKQINISDSNMSNWRNNLINFSEEKIDGIINVLDTLKGVLLLS